MADTTVENSWNRIVGWLRQHTPVTAAHLGPPAAEEEIEVAEALLGRPLPADLLAWWRRSCGVTGFREGQLIPGYMPCTLEEAVDYREMLLNVVSCDEASTADLLAQPAGSPGVPGWLPVWLPIAQDGCGWYLFTDLRSGPASGCVMEWDKYEAVPNEPLWSGVTTMLAEIADAFEHGKDVQGRQPEADDDGLLDWV